jgi:hypothetical protein
VPFSRYHRWKFLCSLTIDPKIVRVTDHRCELVSRCFLRSPVIVGYFAQTVKSECHTGLAHNVTDLIAQAYSFEELSAFGQNERSDKNRWRDQWPNGVLSSRVCEISFRIFVSGISVIRQRLFSLPI